MLYYAIFHCHRVYKVKGNQHIPAHLNLVSTALPTLPVACEGRSCHHTSTINAWFTIAVWLEEESYKYIRNQWFSTGQLRPKICVQNKNKTTSKCKMQSFLYILLMSKATLIFRCKIICNRNFACGGSHEAWINSLCQPLCLHGKLFS